MVSLGWAFALEYGAVQFFRGLKERASRTLELVTDERDILWAAMCMTFTNSKAEILPDCLMLVC